MEKDIQKVLMELLIKQKKIGNEINDLRKTKRNVSNQISRLILEFDDEK